MDDIVLPKILRCHHVFCFTCLGRYFLEFKQTCPICLRSICLKEIKSIKIEHIEFKKGDSAEFVLMKKNLKNFKVDFYDPDYTSQKGSINFLNKVQSISVVSFEQSVLQEVEELHNNPVLNDIDSLVIEFCQFISLQAISTHENYTAPPFIGKRALLNSNKTFKENITFFYQHKEGLNLFLHPIEFDALYNYFGGPDQLPIVLNCKIEELERFCQSHYYRKLWPQFSHVSVNFDMEFGSINLNNVIPDYDSNYYQKKKAALNAEIQNSKKNSLRYYNRKSSSHQQNKTGDEYNYDDMNHENFDKFAEITINKKKPSKMYQENKKRGPNTQTTYIRSQNPIRKKSEQDQYYDNASNSPAFEVIHQNENFFFTVELSEERDKLIEDEALFPKLVKEVQEEICEESIMFKRLKEEEFKVLGSKSAQDVKKIEEEKEKEAARKQSANIEDEIQMVFIKKIKRKPKKH